MITFLQTENRNDTALYWDLYPLLLEVPFQVANPTWVTAWLNVMTMHKGIVRQGTAEYPIGISTRLLLRGPVSQQSDMPILPSTDAARKTHVAGVPQIDRRGHNINGVTHHYGHGHAFAQIKLTTAGWYRIEGAATGKSSISATPEDGLACLTNNTTNDPPTNKLDVRLDV